MLFLLLYNILDYSVKINNVCHGLVHCDSTSFIRLVLLAQLSQRLRGSKRPALSYAVHRPPSNDFFETAWSFVTKFYIEPPWIEDTKFCSHDQHGGLMRLWQKLLKSSPEPIDPWHRNLVCRIRYTGTIGRLQKKWRAKI